jgi:hypothetical protein
LRPLLRIASGGQDLSLGGPALGEPLFSEERDQGLDQEDDPPRATRFAAVGIGGKLSGSEVEAEVAPIEDFDLLLAGGRVGGEGEGDCVFEGIARIAGDLVLDLLRRLSPQRLQQPVEFGRGGDPVVGFGVGDRKAEVMGRIVVGEFALLAPAIEDPHRVDEGSDPRGRDFRRQLVHAGLDLAPGDPVEAAAGLWGT